MEIFGVYLVNQSSGITIPLYPEKENMIGRGIPEQSGEKGKVLLPHPSISKIHAKITLSTETHEWILHDKSRHGIYINEQKVEKQARLQHGDKITVGPFVLMFYEKFKADDETSEQPLPRFEEGKKGSRTIRLLSVLLVQGVLAATFPKVLLSLSFGMIFFFLFFAVKKNWRENFKLSFGFLFFLFFIGALGISLSFCSITYGLYLR